jgi:hypothetical protein
MKVVNTHIFTCVNILYSFKLLRTYIHILAKEGYIYIHIHTYTYTHAYIYTHMYINVYKHLPFEVSGILYGGTCSRGRRLRFSLIKR